MNSRFWQEALSRGQRRPSKGPGVKILQVLGEIFPNPLEPRVIADKTGLPHENVKKWLRRNDGRYVERVIRGTYRSSATLHLLRRLGLDPLAVHGIVGTVKMSLKGGGTPHLGDFGFPHKGGSRRGEWNGRVVTVQPMAVSGCYRVTCRATRDPMAPSEFLEYVQWLEGCAGRGGVVVMDDFDLGIDEKDHRIRLAGVQSMTMGKFGDTLLKVYNKREIGVLRVEACFHRLDLSPKEVAEFMRCVVTPPYELSDLGLSVDEGRDVV